MLGATMISVSWNSPIVLAPVFHMLAMMAPTRYWDPSSAVAAPADAPSPTADPEPVIASIARAQSLDAARSLETKAQAQAQMQNFLNYGAGYQPGNAQMFH